MQIINMIFWFKWNIFQFNKSNNFNNIRWKIFTKIRWNYNGSLDIKTNLTLPIGDIGTLINDLQEDINLKQNKFSAGTNVTISSNNIISSSDAKNKIF